MHATLHHISGNATPAMSLLFARYVAGQIGDPTWGRIMNILDSSDASGDERVALASFISDAFQDLDPDEVKVPAVEDVEELVTLSRAA